MKASALVLAAVILLAGCSTKAQNQRVEAALPSDMEPATEVRQAVSGKTTDDVSRIVFEMVSPSPNPIVVAKKEDIAALLEGLQQAVRTKIRYGSSGPKMTIYWPNGRRPSEFTISTDLGPKDAYGGAFARAYNHIALPDARIDMETDITKEHAAQQPR